MSSKRALEARMKAASVSGARRKALLLALERYPVSERLERLDLALATPPGSWSDLDSPAAMTYYASPPAARRAARSVALPPEVQDLAAGIEAYQPAPACDLPDPSKKTGRRRVPCKDYVPSVFHELRPAARKNAEPAIGGARTSVLIPGPRGLRALAARYILARLDEVIPSHDRHFRPSKGYPPEMQERDYSRDAAEQAKIHAQVLAWRPALVLNDDPSPASGPPILCARWLVVGGNSRTIALKMYAAQRPETYAAALRHSLAAHLQTWGLFGLDVPDLDKWGVFRLLEGSDYDPRSISRDLNQNWTQSKSTAAEAASCGAVLPPRVLADLAAMMAAPDTTLSEALSRLDIVTELKRAGLITSQNQAEWLRYRGGVYNNALSVQGTQHLARCLVGAVVGSVEALSDASPAAWDLFGRIAPAALSIAGTLPESRAPMQRALAELVELEALPPGQRSMRYRQGSLFDEGSIEPLTTPERAWLGLLWPLRRAPAKAAAKLLEVARGLPRPSPLTREAATMQDLIAALERAGAPSTERDLLRELDR
jgi:hypothetical protein